MSFGNSVFKWLICAKIYLEIVLLIYCSKQREIKLAEIVFEDFCKNLIEEVKFLVPTEKKEFVKISHCFDEEDFITFVSFDKYNFDDQIECLFSYC